MSWRWEVTCDGLASRHLGGPGRRSSNTPSRLTATETEISSGSHEPLGSDLTYVYEMNDQLLKTASVEIKST